MALHLTEAQLTAIMQHVDANPNVEACGLLGGVGGIVKKVYQIPNIAAQPDVTFQMEANAQVRALTEIDEQGLELVAIYHSHPVGSRTDPSETDLREATYPNAYSVIVVSLGVQRGVSLRAFVTRENRAVEVPVVINSDHDGQV
jgi:[CysO sulfur-carrier protein]-S-L-cysteine hydrolase